MNALRPPWPDRILAAVIGVVGQTRRDVVLVDVQLPAMDGLTATELMLETPAVSGWRPRVVVLTAFGDEGTVFSALRAAPARSC